MKRSKLYFILMLSLGIGACNNEEASSKVTKKILELSTVSGRVGSEYLQNVKVCVDCNDNMQCDADEHSTLSDEKSQFTIDDVPKHKIESCPLVAEVNDSTITPATGGAIPLPYTMIAPAGSKVINSLTSLMHFKMEEGKTYQESNDYLQDEILSDMAVDSDFMTLLETELSDSQDYKEAAHQKKVADMLAAYTANNVEVLSESIDNETLTMQQAIMVNSELQIHGLKTLLTEIIALPPTEAEPSIIEPAPPVNINLSNVMLLSSPSAFSKTSNMMQMSHDDLSFMHDIATLQSNRKNQRYHVNIDNHLLTGNKSIDLLKQYTKKPTYLHLSGEFTRNEKYLHPSERSQFHLAYEADSFTTVKHEKTQNGFSSQESLLTTEIGEGNAVITKTLTSTGWQYARFSDSDLNVTIDQKQNTSISGAARGPVFSRLNVIHPDAPDLKLSMTATGYPVSNLSVRVAALKKGYEAWRKKLKNSESRLPENSQLYDYSIHSIGKAPLVASSSALRRQYTGTEVYYCCQLTDYTYEKIATSAFSSYEEILRGGNSGLLLSYKTFGPPLPAENHPFGDASSVYYSEIIYISLNRSDKFQYSGTISLKRVRKFPDDSSRILQYSIVLSEAKGSWAVQTFGDIGVLNIKIPNSFRRLNEGKYLPSEFLIAQNPEKTGFIRVHPHSVGITKEITGVNSQTLEAIK